MCRRAWVEGGLQDPALQGTAPWKGRHVWRRAGLAVLGGGCPLRFSESGGGASGWDPARMALWTHQPLSRVAEGMVDR